MCVCEDWSQHYLSSSISYYLLFEKRPLTDPGAHRLGWGLASRPQRPSWHCCLSAVPTDAHNLGQLFHGCCRSEHRSTHLRSKNVAHWAISSALNCVINWLSLTKSWWIWILTMRQRRINGDKGLKVEQGCVVQCGWGMEDNLLRKVRGEKVYITK